MYLNHRYKIIDTFYTILIETLYDYPFTIFTDKAKIRNKTNIPSFLSSLKKVVNNNEISKELKLYYNYHNLLKHPSLFIMYNLIRK